MKHVIFMAILLAASAEPVPVSAKTALIPAMSEMASRRLMCVFCCMFE
jgi:hypothetical protein